MKEITLIGSGNVAWHLCRAFSKQQYSVQLYSRNAETASEFKKHFDIRLLNSMEEIRGQLVLLCVSDSAIPAVLEALDKSNRVAYTSGITELQSLPQRENLGVFYPLQTFSKARDLNLFEVPFFIEANNSWFAQELFDLAWSFSHKVQFADSAKRKELHLAAVISSNFTNFLLGMAKDYLESRQLDWKLLEPLVRETIDKAMELGPEKAQTGPARRNDRKTLQQHLSLLEGTEKDIYFLLSNAILEKYSHEKL